MAQITLQGKTIETSGSLPKVGETAPSFDLVNDSLQEVSLTTLPSKMKIINIFPSIDTPVCSKAYKEFCDKLIGQDKVILLNVSMDLPFALSRACSGKNDSIFTLSAFRSTFSKDYGCAILTGPLTGLCSRAVVVLDEKNQVLYSEQVEEIAKEPDYEKALSFIV